MDFTVIGSIIYAAIYAIDSYLKLRKAKIERENRFLELEKAKLASLGEFRQTQWAGAEYDSQIRNQATRWSSWQVFRFFFYGCVFIVCMVVCITKTSFLYAWLKDPRDYDLTLILISGGIALLSATGFIAVLGEQKRDGI